jgi:hypothetical protein
MRRMEKGKYFLPTAVANSQGPCQLVLQTIEKISLLFRSCFPFVLKLFFYIEETK